MTLTARPIVIAAMTGLAAVLLSGLPAAAAPAGAARTAPGLAASITAEHLSVAEGWSPVLAAQPGERIRVLISYMNVSNRVANGVLVNIELPKGAMMTGAVTLTSVLSPAGKKLSPAALTGRGLNIGNYGPRANGYLAFDMRLPALKYLHCGVTPLVVPLTERAGTAHQGATLHLHGHNDCPVSMTPVAPPA